MPYEGIVLPIELKKHFINREWKNLNKCDTFEVTREQLLLTNVGRNKGIEPSYSAWKADIITVILIPHFYPEAIIGIEPMCTVLQTAG